MRTRTIFLSLAVVALLLSACKSTASGNQPAKGDNTANSNAADNSELDNNDEDEYCLLPPDARPDDMADKITIGDEAPDFKLNDPHSGKQVALADLRGKTVLLFFWASWCPYCKTALKPEGPMNDLIADAAKDGSGLTVINIGTSTDDNASSQKAFLKTNDVKAISTHDEGGKLEKTYGVLGVPTAVVIGKEGKILTYGSYQNKEYRKLLLEYLRQECVSNPEGS
jgi:peroxiredoxin